jgi:hypothetical protein
MSYVFRLTIDLDNAAFCGDDDDDDREAIRRGDLPAAAPEVARILRAIAGQLDAAGAVPTMYQTIRDINGNDVGRYAAKRRD